MAASEQTKWRAFEELVEAIVRDVSSGCKVTRDDKIIGQSGTRRQIDVSIRTKSGPIDLLTVIDCKDWCSPVDINDVGAFATAVEDVRANKGAMVCNAGFTDGARNMAKRKGIDLYTAHDAETTDWLGALSLLALYDFRTLVKYQVKFVMWSASPPLPHPRDVALLELFDASGERKGRVIELLENAWMSWRLPVGRGVHRGVPLIDDPVWVKSDTGLRGPFGIKVSIWVDRKCCLGELPIAGVRGLRDEVTGGWAAQVTGEVLDLAEVENCWPTVADPGDLSVSPALTHVALRAIGKNLYTVRTGSGDGSIAP